jgi:hypothetical protein
MKSTLQRIPENRKLPILPVGMVLHMDMREYGSFLFSGFPCITIQEKPDYKEPWSVPKHP